MRSRKIPYPRPDGVACRLASRVVLCALLLGVVTASSASAHPFARLAGGVDVSCSGSGEASERLQMHAGAEGTFARTRENESQND